MYHLLSVKQWTNKQKNVNGLLPALEAEQSDENTPKGRKQRSASFNYFLFCLSYGGLVTVTLVLWIKDNAASCCECCCKVPKRSPLATMFKIRTRYTNYEFVFVFKERRLTVAFHLTCGVRSIFEWFYSGQLY